MRHTFLAFLCLCVPATAQIFVSPSGSNTTGNGTAGNPYRTISFAAGVATAGSVINLAPGFYGDDDQIVLGDKDLTLVGAGTGQTIVRPHTTLTQTFPAGPLPGTPTEHRIAIAVDGQARVDLRDFTIDCAFLVPSSGRLYGLYFRDGADGTVQRVEIVNCRNNPLSGNQRPAAAVVRGDHGSGDPCDVAFRECRVADWGKVGIASLFHATMDVEWCRVVAAGDQGGTGPAQVGIQAGYGSSMLARHNTVTDAYDNGSPSASVGILMYDAGSGCRIEANTVARCEDSIATTQTMAPGSLAFVRNNNCTAAFGRGMRIDDQTTVLVAGNVLHANDLTISPAWDTGVSGATLWQNNNYSDYGGGGSYVIPGGGSVDPLARVGCDEFTTERTVDVGMFIEEMVLGDLDGINLLDFAVIRRGAGPRMVVGRSNGIGGFTQQAIPFGNTAALPVAVAVGNFDGQNGNDLAVVTRNTNPALNSQERFWIFLNNGSGNFSLVYLQNFPPATRQPRDLVAGDLNGDGRDDLLIACAGNGVLGGRGLVFFNPGTGVGTWIPAMLPASITRPVTGVALGDLDGNGSLDAVTIEATTPLGTARAFANDGAGSFSEAAGSPVSIGNTPSAVQLLDADTDGDLDILTTSWGDTSATGPGSLSILTNEAGSFAVRTVPTDNAPFDLAVGDVADDADPQTVRPDALVANFGGPTLTLVGELGPDGPGLGSLCPRTASPTCVALADIDGDGYQDALVGTAGDNNLTILPGIATAREDLYGFGCAGTAGRVPLISTNGNPGTAQWPNATYGIRVSNCVPDAQAVFVMGATPGATLAPCALNIGSIVFSAAITTDGNGTGVLPLPVPALPKPFGAYFYCQWAAVDFQGPFLGFGFLSASQGMKVRIGN